MSFTNTKTLIFPAAFGPHAVDISVTFRPNEDGGIDIDAMTQTVQGNGVIRRDYQLSRSRKEREWYRTSQHEQAGAIARGHGNIRHLPSDAIWNLLIIHVQPALKVGPDDGWHFIEYCAEPIVAVVTHLASSPDDLNKLADGARCVVIGTWDENLPDSTPFATWDEVNVYLEH